MLASKATRQQAVSEGSAPTDTMDLLDRADEEVGEVGPLNLKQKSEADKEQAAGDTT